MVMDIITFLTMYPNDEEEGILKIRRSILFSFKNPVDRYLFEGMLIVKMG